MTEVVQKFSLTGLMAEAVGMPGEQEDMQPVGLFLRLFIRPSSLVAAEAESAPAALIGDKLFAAAYRVEFKVMDSTGIFSAQCLGQPIILLQPLPPVSDLKDDGCLFEYYHTMQSDLTTSPSELPLDTPRPQVFASEFNRLQLALLAAQVYLWWTMPFCYHDQFGRRSFSDDSRWYTSYYKTDLSQYIDSSEDRRDRFAKKMERMYACFSQEAHPENNFIDSHQSPFLTAEQLVKGMYNDGFHQRQRIIHMAEGERSIYLIYEHAYFGGREYGSNEIIDPVARLAEIASYQNLTLARHLKKPGSLVMPGNFGQDRILLDPGIKAKVYAHQFRESFRRRTLEFVS